MDQAGKLIASRLKEARIKRGYRSARIFSQYNNLAESTYAQHESGKRKLNIDTLLQYSQILSVDPCWLLTGNPPFDAHAPFINLSELSTETDLAQDKEYMEVNIQLLTKVLLLLVPSVVNRKVISASELTSIIYRIYNDICENDKIHSQRDIEAAIRNALPTTNGSHLKII